MIKFIIILIINSKVYKLENKNNKKTKIFIILEIHLIFIRNRRNQKYD